MKKYESINKQYINGVWREGSSSALIEDLNPFDKSVVATFKAASVVDLNEAYESAAVAQKGWAKKPPNERSNILLKVADIIEARQD